jgi:hypothetical protein
LNGVGGGRTRHGNRRTTTLKKEHTVLGYNTINIRDGGIEKEDCIIIIDC